jgi:hypothetical protein
MTRLSPFLLCVLAAAGSSLVAAPALAAAPGKPTLVTGSATNGGGVLTAGPDGADYLLPSLAHLRLAPNTELRIFPVPQPLQLARGAKTSTWSFALLSGRVDVEVPHKPRSAVLASVGKLSAIVTRGSASVLTHGGDTIVANEAGEVRTLLNDHWQTIDAGSLSRFDDEHPAGELAPSIAPPTLAASQRIWLSASAPVSVGGLRWSAVERARAYELRLLRVDGAGEQRQRFSGTEQQGSFASLQPGRYTIAARSIDADGLGGPWSKPEAVRVLGVLLPPGGYAEGGTLFVGANQEVRFSNSDGLEMTYQGAGRFVPASDALTLYRGETTIVSFRTPGSLETTAVRLEPRGIYAEVSIGPSRALWPRDAVQIAVEIKSKTHEPVPAWLEPKPAVLLGVEPLAVTFTREGSRWLATVPPSALPGPWVLRVEVKDQYGADLGRDFLEIAPAPQSSVATAALAAPLKPRVEPPKSEPPVATR